MRWVIYFYVLLPRAARRIYLLIWAALIAGAVSELMKS